ncbi:protein sevenless isoform X2 [Eurosta solidaginis]
MCYNSRCNKGCERWNEALVNFETCQEICISTQLNTIDLPCITACEMGRRRYWDWQKQLVQTIIHLKKPYMQLNNNSVKLVWGIELPEYFLLYNQLSTHIQFQYSVDNKSESKSWRNLANYDCNQSFVCELFDELMPFAVHKFRFKLDLDEFGKQVLYSQITEPFRTLPKGVPLSRPFIRDELALDHGHISIIWKPGAYACGPLQGYILALENGSSTHRQTLTPNKQSFVFANLLPSTNYTIKISMLNANGEGPSAETFIKTKDAPIYKNSDNVDFVVVSGEYSIKIKALELLTDAELVFESEHLINDFAKYAFLGERIFFIIDVLGKIVRVTFDPDKQRDVIPTLDKFTEYNPKKITVDWLNKRLFIAGQTLLEQWSIISTDFSGNDHNVIYSNLSTPIAKLDIDPINGWLFWIQNGSIIRTNLANNYSEAIVKMDVGHFVINYQSYLITFYNTSDKEFYESTYDGRYIKNLNLTLSNSIQPIQNFWYNGIVMLVTNGTHLLRRNYYANEFDIWTVRDLEWCSTVLPITQNGQKTLIQMQPVQLKSPENLNALVTANIAKITWNQPKLNAYQTEYAWQKWDYELEIMDVASNSAFNIRNIKTTYFNVEKLQPNNLYKFRVRIVFGGVLGFWSKALLTRTWPYGEYKFLLANMNGVYEMNETGEHVEQVGQMENVQDFVQLNATIYYISKDNRLQCANMMNPEINCSFIATNATSLAYEWRSGKIYWVDILRNCVMRANLDGSQRELLPIFGAQHIAVDAYNGHIYYSTGVRLVRRYLGDTLDTEEYEYYHVSTYDDMIAGFALNVVGKRLFWVVRKSDGVVQSFHSNTETTTDDLQYTVLENDIKIGSLKFLHEIDSLIWLTVDSNAIVLARTSNSTDEIQIKPQQLNNINCFSLKSEYIPTNDILVVPDAVDVKSVRIIQAANDEWIIKWTPINSSENLTIFYNILLQSGNSKLSIFKTNESFIRIDNSNGLKSNFSIAITPLTYWSSGPTTHAQFQAPMTDVNPPKRIRVFLEQLIDPIEASENVSAIIRWDAPENKSLYTEIAYKIYCYLGDKLYAEKVYNSSNAEFHETIIDGLHIGDSYTFQVQSFAAGALKEGQRSSIQVHINPDLQSKPRFLYSTSEFIAEYDLDLNTHNIIMQITSQVEHLAVIPNEKRILWVNENVELFSLTTGLQPIKLARMRAEVLSLSVDWIQRTVYWAELEKENEYVVTIYELDLCQFDGKVMTPNKLFSLDKGKSLKDLTVLPFSNILLWLELDVVANSSLLMGRNMRNSTFLTFENNKFQKMFASHPMHELETVSLVDDNGNVCISDIQRHFCDTQSNVIMSNIGSIDNIDRDNSLIYVLQNQSVYAFNAKNRNLKYQVNITDIKNIKAYNYQHFPPRRCLLPDRNVLVKRAELLNPLIVEVGEKYVAVMIPSINEIEGCDLKIPGVKYTLWISDNNNLSLSYTTLDNHLNVTELMPFTNYKIQLTISTYYQRKLKLEEYYSESINVRTDIGTPSVPRNFTAYAVSPTQIYAIWNTPELINCGKVWYRLHWQEETVGSRSHKQLNSLNFLLMNLEPSQEYTIWLEVFSQENKFNTTASVMIKTYETPSPLWLVKKTAHNLTLSWVRSPNATRAVLACQEVNGDNEFSIDIIQNTSVIIVPDLEPKTKYEFVLEIFYGTPLDPYMWPELPSEHFVYETLGDCPGRPGQPQIEHTIGDIFRIFWDAAPGNGEQITTYSLEALQARGSKRIRRSQLAYNDYMNNSITSYTQTLWAEELSPIEDKWIVACNTTELSCIIREIYIRRLLMFRVRAKNELYGWGPYSLDSERISEPFVSPEKRGSLVIAIITPAAIVSIFVLILIILRTFQIRRQKAKKALHKSGPSIWSHVSTLQHQQLIASRTRTFSTISHTTLYTGGPLSDADIALLPHINWSQIKILNFLGSGAFGEVYEGLIKHENCDQMEKVAIKSLRKGANEFTELLQEAQLMSNFKHDNIVSLIGVCFDTESISIVMEHMEGGDLLCYLRNARPNSTRSVATLELLDLISMCIDVCNGCSYLEDIHFVHRDLACRNCLVSSNDPVKRMVKIGDFGLARDIYKSDYYRKEGEGLLPVRWMSPESLIDGVFTTQSDVWAFAVLCWEIFTLGQHPYAARNNFEVLNYIKDGGRLKKPDNCPHQLYDLFLKCWSSNPDDRPTFGKCLNQLIEIKTGLRRINLGFTVDNADLVLYANQPQTSFSAFQMNTIFPIVVEKNSPNELVYYGKSTPDNTNLSDQLKRFYQDVDIETISDDSQLIEPLTEKNTNITSCNINEVISRL